VKMHSISALLFLALAGCAGLPRGKSAVTAYVGSPLSLNYVTQDELIDYIKRNEKDEMEQQVAIKMAPAGGKVIYESGAVVMVGNAFNFSGGDDEENKVPFISVKQDGQEIQFCDDADYKSTSTYNQAAKSASKSSSLKLECGIKRRLTGPFQVDILDYNKSVKASYKVTPPSPEKR
jgi:hypothetical protein